jgi:uncharacterized surface protein with fasciclin (FAS1) repeats
MHGIIDRPDVAKSFKTHATAATAAGFMPTLKSTGLFTVFASADDAFAKLPADTIKAVLADLPKLTAASPARTL